MRQFSKIMLLGLVLGLFALVFSSLCSPPGEAYPFAYCATNSNGPKHYHHGYARFKRHGHSQCHQPVVIAHRCGDPNQWFIGHPSLHSAHGSTKCLPRRYADPDRSVPWHCWSMPRRRSLHRTIHIQRNHRGDAGNYKHPDSIHIHLESQSRTLRASLSETCRVAVAHPRRSRFSI